MNVWYRRVGWVFNVELLLIWALGSFPVWLAPDRINDVDMLRLVSTAGLVTCLLSCLAMRRRPGVLADWQGTLQFVACWSNFFSFKAIRQYWIDTPADGALLALDRAIWRGLSLPEHFYGIEQIALSEVLSAAYFCFYFVVLLPVIWFSIRRRDSEARVFFLGLSYLYLIGFAGYLLVPAGGPYMAFPDVFPYPVQGGAMTAFLTARVAEGITGMDVFPSLHSGISLFVLGFFITARQREGYRWAVILLSPVVLGIIVATVYLRYHYGIDLLAGLALGWSAVRIANSLRRKEET
jgi:membrane-associated phospholipid phosphatase